MEKIGLLDVANPRNTKDTTNALITTLNEIAEKANNSVAQIKINEGIEIEPDSLKYTLTLINHNGVESSIDLIIPNVTDPVYDAILSDTSENAVQNKVIKTHIDSILAQSSSTISYFAISAGTEVTGGLQYIITITYLDGHQETQFLFIPRPRIEVDSAMDSTSSNPVQNKVIKGYVDTEVSQLSNELTFKLDKQFGEENETGVYGYTGTTQKTIAVSNVPVANAIPYFDDNYNLKTSNAVNNQDCVNLEQLNNTIQQAILDSWEGSY